MKKRLRSSAGSDEQLKAELSLESLSAGSKRRKTEKTETTGKSSKAREKGGGKIKLQTDQQELGENSDGYDSELERQKEAE